LSRVQSYPHFDGTLRSAVVFADTGFVYTGFAPVARNDFDIGFAPAAEIDTGVADLTVTESAVTDIDFVHSLTGTAATGILDASADFAGFGIGFAVTDTGWLMSATDAGFVGLTDTAPFLFDIVADIVSVTASIFAGHTIPHIRWLVWLRASSRWSSKDYTT